VRPSIGCFVQVNVSIPGHTQQQTSRAPHALTACRRIAAFAWANRNSTQQNSRDGNCRSKRDRIIRLHIHSTTLPLLLLWSRVLPSANVDLYKASDGGSHESPWDVLTRCSREPVQPSLLNLGRTGYSLLVACRHSHT
jgi:hypothetical protein